MAEAAMHESVYRNESQLRIMLAHTLAAGANAQGRDGHPVRQNRRTAYIDAALSPFRGHFDEDAYQQLRRALAMIFGTESMVVFRDVVPLSERSGSTGQGMVGTRPGSCSSRRVIRMILTIRSC
jgi:hypothetical protein